MSRVVAPAQCFLSTVYAARTDGRGKVGSSSAGLPHVDAGTIAFESATAWVCSPPSTTMVGSAPLGDGPATAASKRAWLAALVVAVSSCTFTWGWLAL